MIIKFTDDISLDKLKIGNKAKSLIDLKKNGFNVPDGFVVDANIYFDIIKDNKIDKKINRLLEKLDNVEKVSKEILSLFDGIKVSKEIENSILKNVNDKKLYAVRSSGTKEDMESHSFAGQYVTHLNVKKSEIINRIIDCYKSMFSEVILNYIKNNNINVDDYGMAVVVQEMCDAKYSGICFTCDPINGTDRQMLIEVGEGLGENIVSGQNKPEQYYYNWYDEEASFDDSNKYINKENLIKYAKVFFDIHYFYGYPCDIEFAIKDDKLFILQARRITKIKYQGYKELWSTADFKDGGVSATICYPYMWSLYEYIWEYTLRKFILDSKILTTKEIPNKLR